MLSSRTKPHLLKTLIKRAFHFHNEVRCFRNCEGGKVTLDEIFGCYRNNEFEVVLEDESSC